MKNKTETAVSPAGNKGKFFYICDGRVANEYLPYFYSEAGIEFKDVRTGYRGTITINKAVELHPDSAALLWTDDMVRDVDPTRIKLASPGFDASDRLPGYVDGDYIVKMEQQFVQYVLHSFETAIYRNTALNVYSNSRESREDFIARCMELIDTGKRTELDREHGVYKRRLEQIKEKYMPPGGAERSERAWKESDDKNLFSRYADRIAMFFIKGEDENGSYPPPPSSQMTEFEERLAGLELEARHTATGIKNACREKAEALDEYLLHPNRKDIHTVRSFILWMPYEAV